MFRLIVLRLLESYFRRRWLFLLPILLMLAAAGAYLALSKPQYVAQGILYVQKESLLAKLTSVKGADVTWQTPAIATVGEMNELIRTDAFLRAVIQQTDLEAEMSGGQEQVRETIDQVREAVWTSSIGDNQVMVAASYEQPRIAFQLANATVNTFVQWKINADISESTAAHKFFADLTVRYKVEADQARERLYDYINAHPLPIKGERPAVETLEISKLQADLTTAEMRYTAALEKDENAQLAAAQAESNVRQSYVVIDAPLLPDRAVLTRKDMAIQVVIFMLVGAILSAMGITGAALLDRTFRFPVDVFHGLNLKVLTMIPDIAPVVEKPKKSRRKWFARRERTPASTEGAPDPETPTVTEESPLEAGVSVAAFTSQAEEIDLPLLTEVPEASTVEMDKKARLLRKRKTGGLRWRPEHERAAERAAASAANRQAPEMGGDSATAVQKAEPAVK